ncbi:microsomal signal peptidase 25 kDa subunit-domain-containing protein [Phlyctochytrium arcticum]|nr:microsomal signal peptidase 25 kDa subunit-domain-containing protein [Phlyctochytrium arcticum]
MTDSSAKTVNTVDDKTSTNASVVCQEFDKSPIFVPTNNSAELKHNLDDTVRRILVADYGFSQVNTHIDRRLILGFTACGFAAYASAYSYFVPFPACKPVLAVCVAAYFVLNGLMILYASYFEQNIIFQGIKRDTLGLSPDVFLTIRAEHQRYSPDYKLSFQTSQSSLVVKESAKKPSGKTGSVNSFTKSFGDFYDVEGRLVPETLCKAIRGVMRTYGLKDE